MDPGTWATANSMAGRVSTTTAPCLTSSSTSGAVNATSGGFGEQGVVGPPLLTDGGRAFRAHLAAAKRACAVGRVDHRVVRKREELFVNARV